MAKDSIASARFPLPGGPKTLVIGLGKTGVSCARHLRRQGLLAAITDSRDMPPGLAQLRDEMPDVALFLGGFDAAAFAAAERLVVSPGVPLSEPLIAAAMARGVPVIGDVDLFREAARAPLCAITGSNGKSTVTTLVGLMARHAGLRVGVGGNLGEPMLDLLDDANQLYVLELSSFQLETAHALHADVVTVLNLSPDHLDRYPDLAAYGSAKARIFDGAPVCVVNRDDPSVLAMARAPEREIGFTLGQPGRDDFGVREQGGEPWICHGSEPWMPTREVAMTGRHNLANALAALALASGCGIPREAALTALRQFTGLPHRSQLIAEVHGVRWIDDSKGTNPGATVAALEGLVPVGAAHRVVLIAGGDGKGADFAPLAPAVRRTARAVVLLGRDGPKIGDALAGTVPLIAVNTMAEAVAAAAAQAQPGDCVLLSPACASFDLYRSYEHRGEVFADAVRSLR